MFIILLILGSILVFLKYDPLAFFCVTLGFAILSVGLAFKAIDIAKKSKEIALDSDEKMKSIATSDFLDLAHRFEDIKNFIVGVPVNSKGQIEWPGIWPGTGRSYYIWKCEQILKRSLELLKWDIDPDYQEQFARFYYNGIIKGLEKKIDTINDTERSDLQKMYKHIQKFNVDEKYKKYSKKLLGTKKNKSNKK